MFFCITCDGYICRGKRVVVVGVADDYNALTSTNIAITGNTEEHAAPNVLLPALEMWVVIDHTRTQDNSQSMPLARLSFSRKCSICFTMQCIDFVLQNRHLWVCSTKSMHCIVKQMEHLRL